MANDDWEYDEEDNYDDEYYNYEDYGAEESDEMDDHVKEETIEERPTFTTPQSHENSTKSELQNVTPVLYDNAEETEAYDDYVEEETTARRKKRSATKSKKIQSKNVDAVIGVNYFIDRTFMEEFVDSCRYFF